MRGEVDEAKVGAGGPGDVVDGFVIVEEGHDVDSEGEGEEGEDGIDYGFKGGGGWCLVGVGVGRHGYFEDNMNAFVGIVVIVDATVEEVA